MRFTPVIHRAESCPSTNDLVRQMADEGAAEGTVVVAAEQTAGRGTKGRGWHSPRNKGLYLSVLFRPGSPKISLLPIVAGLAVREAVAKACGLEAELRWPNDLVWRGKKLAGILCESGFSGNRLDFAVLGIGLNVNQKEHDFPPDIRPRAVSVRMAVEKTVDPEALLQKLLESLPNWYDMLCRGEWKSILHSFETHSAFRKGEKVQVLMNAELFSGAFQGLDRDGGLMIKDESGCRHISSAEIVQIKEMSTSVQRS